MFKITKILVNKVERKKKFVRKQSSYRIKSFDILISHDLKKKKKK